MHRIDDSFRRRKEADALAKHKRRIKARVRAAGLFVGLAVCVLAGVWYLRMPPVEPPPELPEQEALPAPAFASIIVDIPGDPLRIEVGGTGAENASLATKKVPDDIRSFGLSGQVVILRERILPSSQKLVTAIPSTPQDFAFFQSQRSTGTRSAPNPVEVQPAPGVAAEALPAPNGAGTPIASNGGWNDIDVADLEGSDASFRKTEIEDNTSRAVLIEDRLRAVQTEDDFRRVIAVTPTADFLHANGLSEGEADAVAAQLQASIHLETLPTGALVAMRHFHDRSLTPPRRKLVQIAFYEPEKFLGAYAVDDNGTLVAAGDPWVSTDLFQLLNKPQQSVQQQRYRLLDGIYSSGLRNGISTSIIGEAIMYLSRGYDLGEFAAQEDVLTLVYSDTARQSESSQNRVLYIGVNGPNVTIRCFVYKPEGGNDFACLDENDRLGTVELTNGMVTPVAGVMTSGFGPRRHPILGKVLMHEGVDWAAPVGTPVRAAFAGEVSYVGEKGSFGNFVQIKHPRGSATGYAHLSRIASGVKPGISIRAGDMIGYVGTTGRSTGPHLHFELYAAGQPIDPLQMTVASGGTGGEAVEALVDRIVRVESGGNAAAKNLLSTATGLGQFIEMTWLRMMQTYRPDLARSLDREKLLALRLDPTLSREMVANLARENKSYLEAGKQPVTAGRLYLAHFLGPEGARAVLASADTVMLDTLLGAEVIRANPFLTGKDVAYVKNWADMKMRHRGGGATPPVTVTKKVEEASPEFVAYRKAMLALVGEPAKL
ncbi:M23 family metallopeptidase [Sinorhizobium fredii]|uniref:M23 family metallopeptidase n=1 Tax=Rhizobium fredii TaxID=380 RepID=UPI0004BC1935|nr:M23 family metallopeptidase [Sinorhizobium fredii]